MAGAERVEAASARVEGPPPLQDHALPPSPPAGAREAVLALQRTAGNAAVTAWLQGRAGRARLQRDTTPDEAREALKAKLRGLRTLKPRGWEPEEADETASDRGPGTPPDEVTQLHDQLPKQLVSYEVWLDDEPTWAQRSEGVRAKRKAAVLHVGKLRARLAQWQKAYPADLRLSRPQARQFQRGHAVDIARFADAFKDALAEVDRHVREAPPPPKHWDAFMGDAKHPEHYHYGTDADPIPLVFYKRPEDYQDIGIPADIGATKAGTYKFPNGPTVRGRLGTHAVTVHSNYHFKVGTKIVNSKKWGDAPSTRFKQIDINYALKIAGHSMAGKDGDHVRDLGFDGKDEADNYWPLKSEINRRPFLGWRAQYGINYKRADDTLSTEPLIALGGKTFVIKAFMSPGDANVPDEGVKPDPKSGTTEV
jgi:hypothetical protein